MIRLEKKIGIRLRISGGLPSQAYYFNLSISDSERLECELNHARLGRKGKSKSTVLNTKDITSILKTILETKVLDLPEEPSQFLPDTLVGRLEITDGESVFRRCYIADKEQAKTQHRIPFTALKKTTDHIFQLGSKVLGVKKIKP